MVVSALARPGLSTHGVSIPDDPSIITPAIRAAITADRFETEEAAELPRIVEDGDVVLEIGAGIGFISTLLNRLPEVQKVIAVEANPDLLPFMAEVHRQNDVTRVDRYNAVLSNALGRATVPFYVRRDFWMGSLSAEPNAYDHVIEVPTRSLDRVIAQNGVTLIVCDIEGAETTLFDGADLGGVDRVYMELHDHVTGLAGVSRVFAAMAGHGFAYDPRHSSKSIVLFRRVAENEVLRPYEG